MTNDETLKYIDDEFATMSSMAIHGNMSPGLNAVLKMVFIAGMSAALAYPGDDGILGANVKTAMENVGKLYGGRKIFPIDQDPQLR